METNCIKHEDNLAIIEHHTALNLVAPKRVLHFSDGVIEEFSDDEQDEVDVANNNCKQPNGNVINSGEQPPSDWGPWIVHKAKKTGTTVLAGCDYVGEFLASVLGITTPKYSSEIEEFKRNQAENKKIEMENENAATWQEKKDLKDNEVITSDSIAMNPMKKF